MSCPRCRGPMKLVKIANEPDAIARVLARLFQGGGMASELIADYDRLAAECTQDAVGDVRDLRIAPG